MRELDEGMMQGWTEARFLNISREAGWVQPGLSLDMEVGSVTHSSITSTSNPLLIIECI